MVEVGHDGRFEVPQGPDPGAAELLRPQYRATVLNGGILPAAFASVLVARCEETLVLISEDGQFCAFLNESGSVSVLSIPSTRELVLGAKRHVLPDPSRFPDRLLPGMRFELRPSGAGLWSESDARAGDLLTEFNAATAAGTPTKMLVPPLGQRFVFFEDVEPAAREIGDILAVQPTEELLDVEQSYSPIVRQSVPQTLPSVLTPTPLLADVFHHVLLPVSRGLPAEVRVMVERNASGAPCIRLESQGVYGGTPFHLRYAIHLRSQAGVTYAPLSLREENHVTLPIDSWDLSTLTEMQCALRRLFIADPYLNPRFRSVAVTLEPFQRSMVRATVAELDRSNSALVVSATGSGKTVVAACVIDDTLQRMVKVVSGVTKALFIVNNVTILADVEKRLREMFGNRYATSRVYGGKEDLTGQVIFATPASLVGSDRLQRVMRTGAVRLFVVDETHHLPAETYLAVDRALQNQAALSGVLTKRLGLTATPVRMDGASVPALFGDHIAAEYSVTTGWREGYLAPMRYVAGDLDINPENKPFVGPNSHLREVYRQRRYADDRFPHIVQLYRREVQDLLVRRGLFVCPNVERAGKMAEYLNAQGIPAVTLTNEDRARPNDWFEHHYAAWKFGAFPPESPFATESIPEVVCAVDIFSEGADVPGLTCIVIWDDSDSVTRVPQIRGRGDRPAPLKAECRFIDTVGVFRKLHILNLLVGGGRQGRKKVGEPEDLIDDAQSDDAEQEPKLELPPGVCLDAEVSAVYLSYLEDVAQLLATRYSNYRAIPASEHARLDRFLGKRVGLQSRAGLDDALRVIGTGLVATRLRPGEAQVELAEMRESLRAMFYSIGIYEEGDAGPIPVTAPTLIVYFRLVHKLQELCPECTLDDIHRLFPEFNPSREQLVRTRALNLRELRVHAMGNTPQQALQGLCAQVLKGDRLRPESPVYAFFEHHSQLLASGTDVDLWRLMEGGSACREEFELGNGTLVQGRLTPSDREYVVTNTIEALLAAPPYHGKVQRDDFDLDRESFRQRLVALGLAQPGRATVIDFCQVVSDQIAGLLRAHQRQGAPEQQRARDGVLQLLRDPNSRSMVESMQPSVENLGILHRAVGAVTQLREHLMQRNDPPEAVVEQAFSDLLSQGGIWFKEPLPELRGAELSLTRYGEDSYMLALHPGHGAQLTSGTSRPMLIALERDYFGNPHLIFEASEQALPLEQRYEELPPAQRAALLRGLTTVLRRCREGFDQPPVIALSAGAPGNALLPDLQRYLLRHTDWDVLGPLTRTMLASKARRVEHTIETVVTSRLQQTATPAYLTVLRQRHKPSNSVVGALGEIYLRWQEFRDEIAPVLAGVEAALEGVPLAPQTARLAQKVQAIWGGRGRKSIGRGDWIMLHSVASHLRPIAEGAAISDGILAEAYVGAYSAVRKFNAEIVGLLARGMHVVRSTGQSFTPEQLAAEAFLVEVACTVELSPAVVMAVSLDAALFQRMTELWQAVRPQIPRVERLSIQALRGPQHPPLRFTESGFLKLWVAPGALTRASTAPPGSRAVVTVHSRPDCFATSAEHSSPGDAEMYTSTELATVPVHVAIDACSSCKPPPRSRWRDAERGHWRRLDGLR